VLERHQLATLADAREQCAGVFTVLFLRDASQRPDIDTVAAQLRKACSEIPGVFPTLNPQPVLQINIGATGSSFGRYTYVLSGINPDQVYAAADKLAARLSDYDGFANPPRSDLFRNTPNLDINIERGRAGLYGVSTTNLESLLRSAYSQNYVYLIKQADDQYQVIVEADDQARTGPGRFPADLRQARQWQQTHSDPCGHDIERGTRLAIG
jgi:multidrug efflux pump subunit AcrB